MAFYRVCYIVPGSDGIRREKTEWFDVGSAVHAYDKFCEQHHGTDYRIGEIKQDNERTRDG
jgi:hypothetical protein